MRRLRCIEPACSAVVTLETSTLTRGLACCLGFRIRHAGYFSRHTSGTRAAWTRGGAPEARSHLMHPSLLRPLNQVSNASSLNDHPSRTYAPNDRAPGSHYPAKGQGSSVGSGADVGRRAGPGARFACRGGSPSTSPQPQPGPPRHTSTQPPGSMPTHSTPRRSARRRSLRFMVTRPRYQPEHAPQPSPRQPPARSSQPQPS